MVTWLRVIATAFLLALGGGTTHAETVSALSCEPRQVGEAGYLVCSIDLKVASPRLFWKGAGGEPYRTFADVSAAVAAEGKSLVFAMNAGMYAEDFSPMGLYIEDRQELRPANTVKINPSSGSVPNFYKQPNGMLLLTENGAAILPTERFLKKRPKALFATQSGPMLVIDGKLNSIFIPGSKDRTRRSGVGVCEDGQLRLAISDGPVNFHDFASLFKDELKCANALFLDGGQGAGIYVPLLRREDWSGHGGYGPMIGLVE